MRDILKKLKEHIFRSWEDEPGYTHPVLKIVPPFIIEILSYFLGAIIIFKIISYLFSLI